MVQQVDAVYENGVLRPLQPLALKEHERVVVSVATPAEPSRDVEYVERLKKELEHEGPAPELEEVRRRLAKIPDSMAEFIIAQRGER